MLTRSFLKKIHSQALKAGVDYALEKVKEKTPTDTKELITSYTATVTGTKGEIKSDIDYAPYVEYGVGGITYSYHKGPPRNNATRFYTGVGARMMTRTADNDNEAIADLIGKHIADAINRT